MAIKKTFLLLGKSTTATKLILVDKATNRTVKKITYDAHHSSLYRILKAERIISLQNPLGHMFIYFLRFLFCINNGFTQIISWIEY